MEPVPVAQEVGKKLVFAFAIDWPGWCRSGRDEEAALNALLAYGPRYAQVMELGGIPFTMPAGLPDLRTGERVEGNMTTDFGAPDALLSGDWQPAGDADLERFQKILGACWQFLDVITQSAQGKELRKGPRGGGRDLQVIIEHVQGGEVVYLARLGHRMPKSKGQTLWENVQQTRRAIVDALDSAVRDGLPERGPRGGKIWPVRFFVRRVAWHVLDHAWEIEDRLQPE